MTITTIAGSGAALIKRRQIQWAGEFGVTHVGGYCPSPEANIPWLSSAIRAEMAQGDGNELGRDGGQAKISALHSSSALAVNVFGYWHVRPAPEVAESLPASAPIQRLHFECKFPTGVGPKSPNMDVSLELADGSLLAIESKFSESYGGNLKKGIQDKYFPGGRELWAAAGLPGAQRAAERVREGGVFKWLDAPQLLKHMLGLATTLRQRPWHLKLLWFEAPVVAAEEMRQEIGRFVDLLGEDSRRFSAATYQELWRSLAPRLGGEHAAYRDYIGNRYFPDVKN